VPFRSEIDPAAGLATLAAGRRPSDVAETLAALRALAADPRFGPGFGVLLDVRGATTAPRAAEGREIAYALANPHVLGRHPVALLVDGAVAVQVGMANVVATLAELGGGTVRAFTDAGAARAWLAAGGNPAGQEDAPRAPS
jgi:hypothetical protein